MDSQRFRTASLPTFKPVISKNVLEMSVKNVETPSKSTEAVHDPRYPNYASIMEDGRLVTDYKSHCAANTAPSEYGNSMRAWFQHNADAFIQVSRKRQADRAGAHFYKAATVPDPKQIQQCNEYECNFLKNKDLNSIGLERIEGVPSLFGTFSEPSRSAPSIPDLLTREFEGGRNTPRGRTFTPLGNKKAY
jgi:hypothetical protein